MCMGGSDKPEEMESRKALAMQAAIYFNQYGKTGIKLENQLIDSVQGQFSQANYADAMAAGQLQAAAAYEPGIAETRQAAINRGFDPGSGAFQSESDALRMAQARAMGQAGADRAMSNTDMGLYGLQNLVKIGQGQQADAFKGQMDVADLASGRIRDMARDDFSRSTSAASAAGTGVGSLAAFGINRSYA